MNCLTPSHLIPYLRVTIRYVLQAIPITVKSRYIVKDAFTEKKWKFSLSETLSKDRNSANGES